jgi:hypothetical protein
MYSIHDFKIGDRVKVRKGTWTFEGEIADFTRKHIFIQANGEPEGHYFRALPHWITDIVDETET